MASDGDIRVLLILNAVLSFAFSWMVIYLMSLVGMTAFSWRNVGYAAIGLFVLTYLVVLR